METLEATNIEQLKSIEDRLHDARIDLPDELFPGSIELSGLDELDERRSPLRSKWFFTEYACSQPRVWLHISNVESIEVDDQAQVGQISFAKIRYDEARSILRVESHMPTTLFFHVEQLEVKAIILDELVPVGQKWRLSWRQGL